MNQVLGEIAASVAVVAFFSGFLGWAVTEVATGRKSLLIAGAITAAACAGGAYYLTGLALARIDLFTVMQLDMDIQHGGPIAARILAGVAFIAAFGPCLHHASGMWRKKIFVQSVVVSAGMVVGELFDHLPQDEQGRVRLEGLQHFLSDPAARPAGVTELQIGAVRTVAEYIDIVGEVVETIREEHVPMYADGFAMVTATERHVYAVTRDNLDLFTSRAFQRYAAW